MKVAAFLILSLLGYLIFVYARFYHHIGVKNLAAPTVRQYIVSGPKTSGSIYYMAIGDSLTAGVGASRLEKTFVYQFAQHLSQNYSQVKVQNLAVPGAKIQDLINYQLPIVLSQKPDIVTVLIGINDIHGKNSVASFGKDFKYLLSQLQTSRAEIIVLNIPYLGSSQLAYPPFDKILDYQTRQFNGIILSLSGERHLKVVDLYAATDRQFAKDPAFYSQDLFHPSDEGYQLWSNILNNAN